jgi:hypothetical protein
LHKEEPMTDIIAGHCFEDTPSGRRCISTDCNGKTCFMSWLSIRDATAADLGLLNIAHTGALNDAELASIVEERAREEAAVWEAISYAASAGSR